MASPEQSSAFRRHVGRLAPHAPSIHGELWCSDRDTGAGVLMIPGFGGVVDGTLRRVAATLAAAGTCALIADRPGFGGSEGEPRGELDPGRDVEALAGAMSWLSARAGGRLGVWGTSFGAAEALLLAAATGAHAIVAQAPPASAKRHPMVQAELERAVERDLAARSGGRAPATLPLVGPPDRELCAIPGEDALRHLTATAGEGWENRVTLRSVLLCSRVDCAELLLQASSPVLFVGVEGDARALQLEAVPPSAERVLFQGAHFDLYGRLLPAAADEAAQFFQRHLLEGRS